MKKYLKEIVPALILAFVASFMLFIYEPIIMYSSNISDFWFDIYTLIQCNIVAFLSVFIIIAIFYNLTYFIETKVIKKNKNIYNIFLILGFIVFLVTYIQGNYLSGALPVLDGTPIEWSGYKIQKVFSVLILIAVTTIVFFTTKKIKYEKSIKILKYITLAVFCMLTVSLVTSVLACEECLDRKEATTTATIKNIEKYSTKQNLIVLLLDAIDSKTMEKVIDENEEFKHVLDDFTYFPDTVGGYPFTRDSIPLILSGKWSENKTDFGTFYNEAMDESKLLKYLKERNYDINIYENEFYYTKENARAIKNLSFEDKTDLYKFIKQEMKYDLFKYLPFYIKQYSRIETMDFKETRKQTEDKDDLFRWEDKTFYREYLEKDIKKSNNKQFKFIHIEGAHYPLDCDKYFNDIENGTIEDKMGASMTLVDKYLKILKENNLYDNSAIVILADHGFWWDTDDESLLKRQNPILYIKGFNERHERTVSNEKVSYEYLQDMFRELLDGAKASNLLDNIENSGPRRFMLYGIGGYDHMVEYMQYGYSNDFETLKPTGNTFDR